MKAMVCTVWNFGDLKIMFALGDKFNVFESAQLCLNVNSNNAPDHVELTDNGSCKMTDEPPLEMV